MTVLVIGVAGCGEAPPKEIPKVTPDKQAELDKGHAEANKTADPASKPAEAPK